MKESNNKTHCRCRRRNKRRAAFAVILAMIGFCSLCGCSDNESLTDKNSEYIDIGLFNRCRVYNDYEPLLDCYNPFADKYDVDRRSESEFDFNGAKELVSGSHHLYIDSTDKMNLSMKGAVENLKKQFSMTIGNRVEDFEVKKTSGKNKYKIWCTYYHDDEERYLECLVKNVNNGIGYMIETCPVQDRELVEQRLSEMFKTYDVSGYDSFKPEKGYPVKVKTDFASVTIPKEIKLSELKRYCPFSDGAYILDENKLSFQISETDNYNVAVNTSLKILKSEIYGNQSAAQAVDNQLSRYYFEKITTDDYYVSKAGELWPDCDPDIRDLPVHYFTVYYDDKIRVCTEYYFDIGSDLIQVFFYHTTDAEKYEDEVEKVRSMINRVDFFT